MRDKEFSRIGGMTQIGVVRVDDTVPTAGTNGCDTWYGTAFVMAQTREQMRYVVAHEQFHKGLHHCIGHQDIVKKYPRESNMAMDYVDNSYVEQLDGGRGFVKRPTKPAPLIDPKYNGMSWLEVLSDLLKQKEQQEKSGGGGSAGQGGGETLDEHVQTTVGDGEGEMPEEQAAEIAKQVNDAMAQGEMASRRIRGDGAGGASLTGHEQRRTDWRTPLRAFIQETCEGDDLSRWCPPNKRLQPLGILLPSHFTETVGELIIAADTSGSMMHLYPVLFGEVARLLVHVKPAGVRVIWWSDGIEGEQVFGPKDYANMAQLLKPRGCGGTRVSCVAEHIEAQGLKAVAVVYLTDGEIERQYKMPKLPCLWGVFDNPRWMPSAGKVLHINSRVDLCGE